MNHDKAAFDALVHRVGPQKFATFAHFAMNMGDLIGNAPPGAVVGLLAKATQAELDAVKTVKDATLLLLKQHAEYTATLFDGLEQGKEPTPIDLSFIKELAAVTGAGQQLDDDTTEALLESTSGSSGKSDKDFVFVVPGNGSIN